MSIQNQGQVGISFHGDWTLVYRMVTQRIAHNATTNMLWRWRIEDRNADRVRIVLKKARNESLNNVSVKLDGMLTILGEMIQEHNTKPWHGFKALGWISGCSDWLQTHRPAVKGEQRTQICIDEIF